MTEDQVRALVREALARHLGTSPTDGSAIRPAPRLSHDGPRHALGAEALAEAAPHDQRRPAVHIAHGRFVFLAPAEPDAPCIVEPQVKCHHCGFCQSYGH